MLARSSRLYGQRSAGLASLPAAPSNQGVPNENEAEPSARLSTECDIDMGRMASCSLFLLAITAVTASRSSSRIANRNSVEMRTLPAEEASTERRKQVPSAREGNARLELSLEFNIKRNVWYGTIDTGRWVVHGES